ncbi:Tryptophan aminotransferase-related protein 2 [Castilleja foliolosa]|uniref:Tryptophan aminotransferase-related protein 2 n=1 Tax=Castilleja foliolosa TaxID=1961234 RepID=A0ABD3DN89_9LAMI
MELKTMILGHFLLVSLALNAGFIFKDYSKGKYNKAQHILTFKNDSLVTKPPSSKPLLTDVIDLDHGDPTMYERYWQETGDKTTVVIPGWKFTSYFSDTRNVYWFLEPEFGNAVIRLHKLVGNAVTDERYIVVGTGATQLFQAVLYAVAPRNASEPINVVSAAPFYTSYKLITDYLKSGLYKWGGDARIFENDNKPYIEVVTSPNNPDGSLRRSVVNRKQGKLIHDLAYYWPQYTSISLSPADHDIMLFTVSKTTGSWGWALVKDNEIAKKMTEFIVLSTLGVSKESQLRAAKILQVVSDSHQNKGHFEDTQPFFDHSYNLIAKRWERLRSAVKTSTLFSLPEFPHGRCSFSGRTFATQPAFAWLKCEGETDDCESFLRHGHNIITRSGKHFGDSAKYVRISVLPRDELFDQFVDRLAVINST